MLGLATKLWDTELRDTVGFLGLTILVIDFFTVLVLFAGFFRFGIGGPSSSLSPPVVPPVIAKGALALFSSARIFPPPGGAGGGGSLLLLATSARGFFFRVSIA